MVKKLNLVGLIAGILVIALAVVVFFTDVAAMYPNVDNKSADVTPLQSVEKGEIVAPSYEDNKYYGGDAYTGMQQAAAQSANNLIPVFEAVEENSKILVTYNENLIQFDENLNENIELLRRNNREIGETQAENADLIVSAVQSGISFILLAIGLAIISKSFVLEIQFVKKEKEVTEEA